MTLHYIYYLFCQKLRDFNRFLIFVTTYPNQTSLKNQDFENVMNFPLYIIFILSKLRDFNRFLIFVMTYPTKQALKIRILKIL